MIPEFRELEAEEQGRPWNLSHFHSLFSIRTITLAECVSLEGTRHSPPSGVPALSLHPLVQVTKHHVECSALTVEQGAAGSLARSGTPGSRCATGPGGHLHVPAVRRGRLAHLGTHTPESSQVAVTCTHTQTHTRSSAGAGGGKVGI